MKGKNTRFGNLLFRVWSEWLNLKEFLEELKFNIFFMKKNWRVRRRLLIAKKSRNLFFGKLVAQGLNSEILKAKESQ